MEKNTELSIPTADMSPRAVHRRILDVASLWVLGNHLRRAVILGPVEPERKSRAKRSQSAAATAGKKATRKAAAPKAERTK